MHVSFDSFILPRSLITFYFRYPLGIRTITTDEFTVSGSDIEISRSGTGSLSYTIEVANAGSVKIGDWNQFKVRLTDLYSFF